MTGLEFTELQIVATKALSDDLCELQLSALPEGMKTGNVVALAQDRGNTWVETYQATVTAINAVAYQVTLEWVGARGWLERKHPIQVGLTHFYPEGHPLTAIE